jgi:Domain of unknown function (DUF4157)
MRQADLDNAPPHRLIGSVVTAPRQTQRTWPVPPSPGAASLPAQRVAREYARDPLRLLTPSRSARASSLLQLQREHGNRFVQRVIAMARSAEGEDHVTHDVERAIEGSRGGGHSLDSGVKASMGQALNAGFSDVRVHTDADADALNQSVSARAFTTGRDIYFRQGEYNPGSSGGRELLAHELTHVVQQNPTSVQAKVDDDGGPSSCACGGPAAGPQMKLSVSQPGDLYEQEADRVASAVMHHEQQSSARSPHAPAIDRQMPEEEKDKLHGKYHDDEVRRQVKKDEEEGKI